MMGKTEEEMKKEYEPQAIDAINSRLTLEKVIELEKIEQIILIYIKTDVENQRLF